MRAHQSTSPCWVRDGEIPLILENGGPAVYCYMLDKWQWDTPDTGELGTNSLLRWDTPNTGEWRTRSLQLHAGKVTVRYPWYWRSGYAKMIVQSGSAKVCNKKIVSSRFKYCILFITYRKVSWKTSRTCICLFFSMINVQIRPGKTGMPILMTTIFISRSELDGSRHFTLQEGRGAGQVRLFVFL